MTSENCLRAATAKLDGSCGKPAYNGDMFPSSDKLSPPLDAAGRFATTHWSCVLAAKDRTSPRSRDALASLCSAYWYPLDVELFHETL